METKQILDNIASRAGIKTLNTMQQTMATTTADRVMLIAPTGSGKTIAFTIRLLRSVDVKRVGGGVQALVIAPARELVLQVTEVIRSVATGLKVTPLYGGHRFDDEASSLSVVPDIIVATPGRLLDHLNRRTLALDKVTSLVLDEYDKSLELGFADEMRSICRQLRRLRLVVLTSATMLTELPRWLVDDGREFEVMDYGSDSGAPTSAVDIVEVPSPVPDKLDTLTALLRSLDNQRVIVFVNHREAAERVWQRLKSEHLPVGIYHGGLEQSERRHALTRLENDTTPILVSTDLGARGLDITDVGSVIHYHLPVDEATWTHRNGRTGRQGATGTIYVIVNEGDSLADYIEFDRQYSPGRPSVDPIRPGAITLHFNAGRKEKVSRGDIVGFLTKAGGVGGSSIGAITLDDHEATVAVTTDEADALLGRLKSERLKGKRVRVSLL